MILVARQRRSTVSIRNHSRNQTLIAFSASLVRELKLKKEQWVLMYLDANFARFKVQLTEKDDVAKARRLIADGAGQGLLISCSGIDPKRFRPGKYDPITTKVGWISIDLDDPRKKP